MGLVELFLGRHRQLESRLQEYLDHWISCFGYLRDGMRAFLEEGPGEQVDFYYSRVDRAESQGDEVRRRVETTLYSKALLPESRGDILRMLEAFDVVINRVESLLRQIVVERIEIESWMQQDLLRLVDATINACEVLHKAGSSLLHGKDRPLAEMARQVDELESRCDHLENDLLGRVFASDLDLARKLQLKDLIRRLGTISDLAESAADQVHIVGLKRRV
jgi:predicted phosphate transport protein (TIGR00153 family)